MIEQTFDAITRRAAGGVSRRATIATLGTAGFAAIANPFSVDAKKSGGKNKKKSGGKNKKSCPRQEDRCAPQVAECTTFLTALCGGDPTCQDSIGCCTLLGSCAANSFLTCLANAG
jgi:hypothetical protein